MAKRRSRDLTVGLVFALGLAVFAIAIMTVGGESRYFAAKRYFGVTFSTVDGLTIGSPVKMSGVQVGTVSDIRLPTDPEAKGIEVEVGVDEAFVARVREDSRAELRILQILTGEKFVEISAGSPGAAELPEGAEIPPSQASEILEQAQVTAENLNQITVSLKKILDDISEGRGLFGQMVTDPEFGKEGLDALRGTVENLEALTGDMRRGRGFVGKLLYDEEFAGKVDELGATIERLSVLVGQIDLEGGALGKLMGPEGEALVADMRSAASEMDRAARALNDPEGLVGKLLHDEDFSAELATDLKRTLGNLAEITDKINSGEGTLGALVNERVLHDGMEEVVAGINDSKFARWLIRHYQKKGIKAEDSPDKP